MTAKKLSSGAVPLVGSLLILALVVTGATSAVFAVPSDWGLGFELRSSAAPAAPPLPDPSTFPVQLVLDDDGAEGVFGFSGSNARQFLWFNHFDSPGPFTLEEIWVLFPSGMDVPLDGTVQLAVFLDPDRDPATGAQLLATYDETIQAVDGSTFSVYPLATPLEVEGGGDILIGVVNRYFLPGVPPPTQPAALDTTLSENRSYFALWTGDAPDPPDLDTAIVIDVLDGQVSGNFMIRGFGSRLSVLAIPTLGSMGPAVLVLLLVLLALAQLRRLRRAH